MISSTVAPVIVNEDQQNTQLNKEENTEIIPEKKKCKIIVISPITEDMTIIQIARQCPAYGWLPVMKYADKELETISEIVALDDKKYGPTLPLRKHMFRALELTPMKKVKVVIIGQDPYPAILENGLPRAQGLSFSVSRNDAIPSSLQNIYKELSKEYPDFVIPKHGDLTAWAKQGVLLLNACLTYRRGGKYKDNKEYAKYQLIWRGFLDKMLKKLVEKRPNTIFVLWGDKALKLVDDKIINDSSPILTSAHPSGLSAHRGFLGNNHFIKINKMLKEFAEEEINWQLT